MKAWHFHFMATTLLFVFLFQLDKIMNDFTLWTSMGGWMFICEGFAAVLDRLDRMEGEDK